MDIGIDIGGTNIRVGSLDLFLSQKIDHIYSAGLAQSKRMIKEVAMTKRITGIGVAIAGDLDANKTTLVASPNLLGWIGHPLKHDLELEFDCLVILENDVVTAALGEDRTQDFLYLALGTGVGAANVRYDHGVPVVTPTGIGHQIIVANGILCHCGKHGCLEAYYQKSQGREIVPYLVQGLRNYLAINPVPQIIVGGGAALSHPEVVTQVGKELGIFMRVATYKEKAGVYGAMSLLTDSITPVVWADCAGNINAIRGQ